MMKTIKIIILTIIIALLAAELTQTVAQKQGQKTPLNVKTAFELLKPDNIKNSETFDNFLRQYCGAYEIGKHLRYRMKNLYEEAKPKCGDGSRIDTYSQMYEGAKNDSIPPKKDRLYVLEQKLNPPRR